MSYTNLIFHIVFGTKGRLPMISNEIKAGLYSYMGGTVRGLGGVMLEINGVHDHIHLLVKLKPSINMSDFMRDLKSSSSKWAKENGISKFTWQRRYGAFTVSESQLNVVKRYIQNQEEHHKRIDFKTEFENFLKANGIVIDDFVWQD